jgi:hypothetical protein
LRIKAGQQSDNTIAIYYNYLHVISGTNLNENVLSIVIWDRIHRGLDGPEIGGPINVDGDDTVADGSDPNVVVLGGVCRSCVIDGTESATV